jgi:DNA repair protein RecN (Recombination protein N)
VAERLGEVRKTLDGARQIDAALAPMVKGISDAVYLIEDATAELRSYLKAVQIDEGRLEEVEARLDALSRLKRKYGGSLAAVMQEADDIRIRLDEVRDLDRTMAATADEIAGRQRQVSELAVKLSAARRAAAEGFAKRVVAELSSLRMEQTLFQVRLERLPLDRRSDLHLSVAGAGLSENGIDRATFLIAPNPGEALKPMAGIASGGELSRVVLALKAILSAGDLVETIVFDEVDAGIGGGVAEVVGRKLAHLARRQQVLCITHLPQIAKFGDHHFRIVKSVADGRTLTRIDAVCDETRVEEIARMLGGVEITDATRRHARELLQDRLLTKSD